MRNFSEYQALYKDQPYEEHLIRFRKRKISEILSNYNHDRLLEIGCGLEPIFTTVDTFQDLFIVEPAEFFIASAEQLKSKYPRPEKIQIVKGLFEDHLDKLILKDWDFILLSCLLHEIEKPVEFLKAILKVSNPKTVIHINTPNAKSFHRLLAVEMGLIKDEFQMTERNMKFRQHHIFDLNILSDLVESCGFEIIEKGAFSFKPFTHVQMEQMIQANLLTMEMLEGFYKMEKYLLNLGSEIFVNIRKKQTL